MYPIAKQRTNPWPGPRPYDVLDGPYFCGREDETNDIYARVINQRLTILSGSSGVGKTSLLKAGVVWNLVKARRHKTEYPGEEPWPILLLSDWGGAKEQTIEKLFWDRLGDAIDSLRQWQLDEDHQSLSSIDRGPTFVDHVSSLCQPAGGIILVFDQFEEVFRAMDDRAHEAVKLIEKLVRSDERVHVLISLRAEYHSGLRDLEASVGPLYGRTYFLKPMIVKTVQQAIAESAQAGQICVENHAAETIIDWLKQAERQGARSQTLPLGGEMLAGTQNAPVEGNGLPSHLKRDEQRVDLLTLQALLFELYDYCERMMGTGRITINAQVLDEFRREQLSLKEQQAEQSEQIAELVRNALERWITRALQKPAIPKCAPLPEIYRIPEDKLTGMVYRVAARMAPYLSSGGYKISTNDMDLVHGALHEELQRLCSPDDMSRKEWDQRWSYGDPARPRLERKKFTGLTDVYSEESSGTLSGLAHRYKWSPADTAEQLIAVYTETQRRLKEGNILKRIQVQNITKWELVHDKLGTPLSLLADKQKDTWEDCVNALTVVRGMDIKVGTNDRRDRNVDHAYWQGCFIFMQDLQALDRFVFAECNFRGTLFYGCDFRGGRFEGCIMDGALFVDCRFELGPDGQPLTFVKCRGNGISFMAADRRGAESIVNGLRFENCDLSQSNWTRLQVGGSIVVDKKTRLLLCDFNNLRAGPSAAGMVEFLEGTTIQFSSWDNKSQPFINIHTGCNLVGSGLRSE